MTGALPIRIVLDHTAITSYAAGTALDVGEVIREVADEGAGFGVPTLCLVEAAAGMGASLWAPVGVLLAHSRCVRLEVPPVGWRNLARATALLGSQVRAVALLWAVEHGGYVVTGEPAGYGPYEDRTIGI